MFGVNPISTILLKILGIEKESIPRFRDCFISDGHIVIYTRTGGGNRDYYDEPNSDNQDGPYNSTLRENKNYVYDEDDDFDPTYANFYFKFPEEYRKDLESFSNKVEDYTPSEKWQMLFDNK
jgi:hypothetical protein